MNGLGTLTALLYLRWREASRQLRRPATVVTLLIALAVLAALEVWLYRQRPAWEGSQAVGSWAGAGALVIIAAGLLLVGGRRCPIRASRAVGEWLLALPRGEEVYTGSVLLASALGLGAELAVVSAVVLDGRAGEWRGVLAIAEWSVALSCGLRSSRLAVFLVSRKRAVRLSRRVAIVVALAFTLGVLARQGALESVGRVWLLPRQASLEVASLALVAALGLVGVVASRAGGIAEAAIDAGDRAARWKQPGTASAWTRVAPSLRSSFGLSGAWSYAWIQLASLKRAGRSNLIQPVVYAGAGVAGGLLLTHGGYVAAGGLAFAAALASLGVGHERGFLDHLHTMPLRPAHVLAVRALAGGALRGLYLECTWVAASLARPPGRPIALAGLLLVLLAGIALCAALTLAQVCPASRTVQFWPRVALPAVALLGGYALVRFPLSGHGLLPSVGALLGLEVSLVLAVLAGAAVLARRLP